MREELTTTYDQSSLLEATCKGNITLFNRIRAANASLLNFRSRDGWNVLFTAVANGQLAMFNHITTDYPKFLKERTYHNSSVLHIAAANGHMELFIHIATLYPKLLRKRSNAGWSVIHIAAANGRLEMFKHIATTYPALVYEKDKNGLTVLHIAIVQKRIALFKHIATTYPKLIGEKNNAEETIFTAIDNTALLEKEGLKQSILDADDLIFDAIDSPALLNKEDLKESIITEYRAVFTAINNSVFLDKEPIAQSIIAARATLFTAIDTCDFRDKTRLKQSIIDASTPSLTVIDNSAFIDKDKLKQSLLNLYTIASPKEKNLRACFACILYSPQRSRFATLPEELKNRIMEYLVYVDSEYIDKIETFYSQIAEKHIEDSRLTQAQFAENEVKKYLVSHVDTAAEFMINIITRICSPLHISHDWQQLKNLISTTLRYIGAEIDWVVSKGFRKSIMVAVKCELLEPSIRGTHETQAASFVRVLTHCTDSWVEKYTVSRREQRHETQIIVI